jgi:ATP-dependent helicase Lhr and Lhr-like helicase
VDIAEQDPEPDPEPDPWSSSLLPETFQRWFASRGWSPREHQLALLRKARDDRSALLIAPTGAGKTLAGFLPTLVELSSPSRHRARGEASTRRVPRLQRQLMETTSPPPDAA